MTTLPCYRIILCALGLALSALLPAQITVEVDRPEAGHFWAVGPLPIDTAPILIGPSGIRAYRLGTVGSLSAIYGIESFAEHVPADGVVPLVPAEAGDPIALWWAHPAVLDDPAAIAGDIRIDGSAPRSVAWTAVDTGEHRLRFRAVHEFEDHLVSLWCDVFARSPVVHVAGFIARKDRALERGLRVVLGFGERIAFPQQRLHGGTLALARGAIRGTVDLEHGGIYPIRFSLLCSRQPPRSYEGPDATSLADLDDLDSFALEAGAAGPRWFVPRTWSGEWLGVRNVPIATPAGEAMAAGALESFVAAHRMTDRRPWASMPAASQGGAQPSLSLSWYAPALVGIEHRPHDVHLWSADDLLLRPMHLFEPGTADPIRDLRSRGATVAARQVFEAGIDLGGQQYPRYRTRGKLAVDIGGGNVDVRQTPDELHTADLPAVAAYAMTDDPVVRWTLDSLRGLDAASRAEFAGWRSSGRGEARTGTSMLLAAQAVGGTALEQTKAHLIRRLEIAIEKASSARFPVDAVSRPLAMFSDGRLNCRAPQVIAYEEAQLAYYCWLLYTATGDDRALAGAYRWGLTVAATLYQRDGRWRVPYAFHQLPDGAALSDDQLRNPEFVHESSGWTLGWSAAGLRALLAASDRVDVPQAHQSYLDRARRAVDWIDVHGSRQIDVVHQGLLGGDVALPR